MTREEAIEQIYNISDGDIVDRDDLIAFGVAIEALADLQPTCNQLASDFISRQAAIDAVDAIGHIATMQDGDKCF